MIGSGVGPFGPYTPATPQRDDAPMRIATELVAARLGASIAIEGVSRSALDDGSSHAATVVAVTLAGGVRIELFVKDFGASRYAKDDPRRQAERELWVYRDLLPDAGLGTAAFQGVEWQGDGAPGPLLFLEHVRATPLSDLHPVEWDDAARWLARLQDHGRRHPGLVRDCPLLLRHDADYFWSVARSALVTVAAISSALEDRLGALLRRYGPGVAMMAMQPPTLVHGAFKPRHILVDRSTTPRRVCPVDWELTALGSALYDLAFLAYGVRPAVLDRLLDAYRAEARTLGLLLAEPDEMRRLVDWCRLHRALKSLGRACERGLAEDRVAKRVAAAERLAGGTC